MAIHSAEGFDGSMVWIVRARTTASGVHIPTISSLMGACWVPMLRTPMFAGSVENTPTANTPRGIVSRDERTEHAHD